MRTLLYVDDSPDDRLLLESACRLGGVSFCLKTLEGGVEATRYLNGDGEFANRAEHPLPDLIFLDLKMPEVDGFEVLRSIRANPATHAIPVALYSASPITEDVAKGYSEGATYFIIKPPHLATLTDIIRAVNECLAADPMNYRALAPFSAPAELR